MTYKQQYLQKRGKSSYDNSYQLSLQLKATSDAKQENNERLNWRNLLTDKTTHPPPWKRVLPQKITDPQLVNKFPHLMEREGLLPHSQAPATCPYPKTDQSSICLPITLLEQPF